MAPPPDFLPDNMAIDEGTNVTNISAEGGTNMMNISAEGVPMVGNSGVDGGAGTKKPSKM